MPEPLLKKAKTAEERQLLSKLGRVKNLWEDDSVHDDQTPDDRSPVEMDYEVEAAVAHDQLVENLRGHVRSSTAAECAESARVAVREVAKIEPVGTDVGRDERQAARGSLGHAGEIRDTRRTDQRFVTLDDAQVVAGHLVQNDLVKGEPKREGKDAFSEDNQGGQTARKMSTDVQQEQQQQNRTSEGEKRTRQDGRQGHQQQSERQQQRPQKTDEQQLGKQSDKHRCPEQQCTEQVDEQERQEIHHERQQNEQLKLQKQHTQPGKQDRREKKQQQQHQQQHSEKQYSQDQQELQHQERQQKQPEKRRTQEQQQQSYERQPDQQQYEQQRKKKKNRRRNKRNSGSRASESEGDTGTRGQGRQGDNPPGEPISKSSTPEGPLSTIQRSVSHSLGESKTVQAADQEKASSEKREAARNASQPTKGQQRSGESRGDKFAVDSPALNDRPDEQSRRQYESQKRPEKNSSSGPEQASRAATHRETEQQKLDGSRGESLAVNSPGPKKPEAAAEGRKKTNNSQYGPQTAGAGVGAASQRTGKQRPGDTGGENTAVGPTASDKLTEKKETYERQQKTKITRSGPQDASRAASQQRMGKRSPDELEDPPRDPPNTDEEEVSHQKANKSVPSVPQETSRTANQRKGKQKKADLRAQPEPGRSGGSTPAPRKNEKQSFPGSAGQYSEQNKDSGAAKEPTVSPDPDKPASSPADQEELPGSPRAVGAKKRPQSGGKRVKGQRPDRNKASYGSYKSTEAQRSSTASQGKKEHGQDIDMGVTKTQNAKKYSGKNERRKSDETERKCDTARCESGEGSITGQPHPGGTQHRNGWRAKKTSLPKPESDGGGRGGAIRSQSASQQ